MPPKRLIEASLILISALMLLTALILPALRTYFIEPSQSLVNDAVSHLAPFDYFYLSKERLDKNWSYKVDSFESGNVNIYYDPSYDDSSWNKTSIPFLFKATQSNSSLWIRNMFQVPEAMRQQKLRLIFSGAWMTVKVWLNGFYLGDHTGYFSSFYFDIDDAVNLDKVNVLTLYLESPVQDSYETRIYPAGIHSFSEIFPDLHTTYIGIWGNVTLVGTLNPVVNLVLVDVKQYSTAYLSFRVLVQNKGNVDESPVAVLKIKRLNSSDTVSMEQSFNLKIPAGEREWNTWDVTLPDPAYWFPWDIGIPNVYLANISLYCNNNYAGSIETIFGIRALEGSISRENSYIKINGINVFLRGGSYFTRFDSLTNLRIKTEDTLILLKEANINFLRAFSHVEPKEFYELTSIKGFIVQLDFPLIGSYPTLDLFESYSRLVKTQFIELLLLTYNYPSIIIVCPHTLPGWFNEKSPYHNSLVNFHLDRELSILVNDVNKKVIVLPYSGEYDKYVDYGWGTGSWVNYIHYKEVIPNIISPMSLPSLNSSFWSSIPALPYEQTLQLLEQKGLDLRLSNAYWISGAYDAASLIRLSQAYQSLVIRHAVDVARILKNNVSIGVSIFPLTDYLESVSGSIVDYYGFEKSSYYEIKNAFNPIHVVILVDGDYQNNLTSLCFVSGSIVRINLWLVNDVLQNPADVVLNWRLTDLASNKSLAGEKTLLKLPSPSSGATLVAKHIFEAPCCTDKEHVLEVSTELCFANGTKIDSNSKSIVVKPISLIRITLDPKPAYPQLFLIWVNESYRIVKVLNETIVAVPHNAKITIIGPSLHEKEVYVPEIISLDKLPIGGVKNVTIKLYQGSVIKVLAGVPSPFSPKNPSQELHVRLLDRKFPNNLLLDYDPRNILFLNLLNITGNNIVVPAETNLSIVASIYINDEIYEVEMGNSTLPINLRRNATVYLNQPALVQVMAHQPLVKEMVEKARDLVEKARDIGFYTGFELYRLKQINETGFLILNTSDPFKILDYQQEAVANGRAIINNVQNMVEEAYSSQSLIFLLVTLLALLVGSIFVEKREQYAIFTIICFIILMTVSYYTFPGFLRAPSSNLLLGALDILTGVYVAIFLFSLVFLAPRFLGEFKSERGVSLIPALRIAVVYSIGNLKKRRFRTLLTLASITTMVLAMSTLTSIRISLATNSRTLIKTWPADKPPISIVTSPSGFLSPEDLCFIGMQREIIKLDYKVITPVAYDALGYIDNRPIYGIRGISPGEPSLELIKEAVYPKDSIGKLFNCSDSVLIDRDLANILNIDVDMPIVFNGVKLKVVGLFDGNLLASIREPDGSNFLPLFIPGPGSGPQPVPSDSLFLTNLYTAQKLGGNIYAVYCKFKDNAQTREVSKRLASLGDYFVIAMPSSESITYYFREVLIEVFGASIFVPVGITILNIAILFYTIVHERRDEIFVFSSIGLNPSNISSLFIIEAGILGFIGGCIGYISSMLMFKIFDVSNIIVPINVKSSPLDMLYLITISSATAIVASLFPALKAAKIATPSLLRRWKLKGQVVEEGIWTEQLPVKIPPEKIEAFVNYLYERIPQVGVISEIMVSNIEREEKMDENGNIMYYLNFKYAKGGSRPFNALAKVEVKKEGESYVSRIYIGPETLRKADVYEVINYVRRLALGWAASKFSLVVAVGGSIDQTLAIVKKYRPQLLVVYSRLDIGNKLREMRRRLRSEGIWPPTIEARKVEARDIHVLVEKLSREIMSIDAVCLDSDDGLLSSALSIAAIRLDKNILTFDSEGKIYETSARKFIEKI